MITGSEFAKLNTEFENLFLLEMDVSSRHHEGLALQQSFKKQVTSLIDVIEDFGNSFMDNGPKLVVFQYTRDCVSDEAASSVRQVKILGKLQYDEFRRDVIDAGGQRIHKSIKRMNFHFSICQNQRNIQQSIKNIRSS